MSKKEEVLFRNYTSNINIKNAYVIKKVSEELKNSNIKFKIIPDFPHKL